MADQARLIEALRAADAAGDTQAATALAQALRASQSMAPAASSPPTARGSFLTDLTAPDPKAKYGGLLPYAIEENGAKRFGAPQILQSPIRVVQSAMTSAFTGDLEGMKTAAPKALLETSTGPTFATGALKQAPRIARQVAGSDAVAQGVKIATEAGVKVADDVKKMLAGTADTIAVRAPRMSRAEIRAASDAAYQTAADAGVVVRPEAFSGHINNLVKTIEADGFDAGLHPAAASVLKRLSTEGENVTPKTLGQIEILRRVANSGVRSAIKSGNADEARITGNIVDGLDEFIEGLGPTALVEGNAEVAVPALSEARRLWKIDAKRKTIDDILEVAADLDDPNYIKTQFRSIVKNRKKFNRFDRKEQEIIKRIARTGALESLGKLAPSLDAVGAMKGVGYLSIGGFSPATAALAGLTIGAKHAGQRARKADLVNLQDQVTSGARRPILRLSNSSPFTTGEPK